MIDIRSPIRAAAMALVACWLLAGCSLGIPADPQGSLERIQGGQIRIGISPHSHLVELHGDQPPTGVEAELLAGFAASLDSSVLWVPGGEEELIGALENGELDVVAGGLTEDTPWVDKSAITRPYAQSAGPDGKKVGRVLAVRMGENALLSRLERYLDDRGQ